MEAKGRMHSECVSMANRIRDINLRASQATILGCRVPLRLVFLLVGELERQKVLKAEPAFTPESSSLAISQRHIS